MKCPRTGIAIATSILKRPDRFFTGVIHRNYTPPMDDTPDSSATCPLRGLPPVLGKLPEVVILGSFPSRQSLMKNEYYGNPRNHFWHIIEALFLLDRHLPYGVRTSRLMDHQIALWDVINTCSRTGSADTRIQKPVFNDLAGFLTAFPSLHLVVLNGSSAGRYYHQMNISASVPAVVLPSTSPANTRYSLDEKIKRWEIIRPHSSNKKRPEKIIVPCGTSEK